MIRQVKISFGALCDPIEQQLNQQGLVISSKDAKHLQKDADAITRLNVRGIITSDTADKARKKLLENILKVVK